MIRLLVDLLAYDLRRIRCARRGHHWTAQTDPIACLWCATLAPKLTNH